MKAHLRGIRISPKKANIIAGLVRGKKVEDALAILKFTPNKGANILYKVVHSAVANAENNDDQKRENLIVKTIIVNKGPVMKRFLPSTRGRALRLEKPTAHLTVELETLS
ncbi:50S ribosomal protein L22 [Candidatus Gracilibacteria bacterium]|nr:50S ribosomal protein L22 [Candidatus Gracilibacteria bacterium]